MGVKFMQRWEEEAMLKREGREEGQILAQISIVRFQFLTKHKTPELIAEDLGLSLEFVQKLCDLLVTHPKKSDAELVDLL